MRLGMFHGYGSVDMMYASLAPELYVGAVTLALEAGLTAYRPRWIEQGVGFQTAPGAPLQGYEWRYPGNHIMLGGVLGASLKYKGVETVLSFYNIDGGDAVQAVYHGIATNLSLRVAIGG